MTRRLVVLVLALTVSGCVPKSLAPEAKPAYAADQIVLRVNELQAAAIQANAAVPPALSEAQTRVIVEFTVSADRTLAAVPQGWYATVRAAWLEARKKLADQVKNPIVSAAMDAVDAVLDALKGQ